MSISRPSFVSGIYTVTPEHPSDWTVDALIGSSDTISLNGTHLRDVMYRKYVYTLEWDAMSVTDYDDMLELFEYTLDNNETVLFTYDKFPQSESGVSCILSMPERKRRLGSGKVMYYSKVKVVLIELAKR